MIDWTTVKRALRNWCISGTGIAADRVRWAEQGAARAAGKDPWASLRVTSIRRIGVDGKDVLDAEVPAPGAEITHRSRGHRECELSVQVFGGSGPEGASERLDRMQAVMNLPSVRTSLQTAGIGVGRITPVQAIDGFLGESTFEPRAVMRVSFFLASEVTEAGTFIEFIELDPEAPDGPPFFVPEDPSP